MCTFNSIMCQRASPNHLLFSSDMSKTEHLTTDEMDNFWINLYRVCFYYIDNAQHILCDLMAIRHLNLTMKNDL